MVIKLPPVFVGSAHTILTFVPSIEIVGARGGLGLVAAMILPIGEYEPQPCAL